MKQIALLALLAAPGLWAADAGMTRELDDVARIASVMVDGDVCLRIMTKRALEYLVKTDPRDPWIGADNFDVNHEAFIQTKKTLMRLSRLAAFPSDVNLWMPVPDQPGKIQVLVRNVHEMSQFWRWGLLYQETPSTMQKVLDTGERVTVTAKPGWVSVLAPVYDSMGDVVGVVEAVAQIGGDPRENVK